jgi:hypothetical protein
MGYA